MPDVLGWGCQGRGQLDPQHGSFCSQMVGTVAILAQGTIWAVAVTQAFLQHAWFQTPWQAILGLENVCGMTIFLVGVEYCWDMHLPAAFGMHRTDAPIEGTCDLGVWGTACGSRRVL